MLGLTTNTNQAGQPPAIAKVGGNTKTALQVDSYSASGTPERTVKTGAGNQQVIDHKERIEELRRAFEEARGIFELAIPVWATQLAVVVAFMVSPQATFPFGLALGFIITSDLLLVALVLPAIARYDRATLLAIAWKPWPSFSQELSSAFGSAVLPAGSWFPKAWFDYFEGPISGGAAPRNWFQAAISNLRTRQILAFTGLTTYLIAWGWYVAARCWGTPVVLPSWLLNPFNWLGGHIP